MTSYRFAGHTIASACRLCESTAAGTLRKESKARVSRRHKVGVEMEDAYPPRPGHCTKVAGTPGGGRSRHRDLPRRLRVLLAVARTGGVLAAADELGITPSAVSQQLNKLEDETGHALVVRTPKGSVLTPPAWPLQKPGKRSNAHSASPAPG